MKSYEQMLMLSGSNYPTLLARPRLFITLVLLTFVSVSGESIYVAVNGKTDASGTVDDPMGSLPRLECMLIDRPGVTEIIFHGGVYRGSFVIPSPNDTDVAKLPRLLVRAADGEKVN